MIASRHSPTKTTTGRRSLSQWVGAVLLLAAALGLMAWRTWGHLAAQVNALPVPPPEMRAMMARMAAGQPPPFFDSLNLTDDQKARFSRVRAEGGSPPQMMQRVMNEILTPEQRTKFQDDALAQSREHIDRNLSKVLPAGEREKLRQRMEDRIRSGLPPPPPGLTPYR